MRRWIDVLLYGALAACAWVLLRAIVGDVLEPMVAALAAIGERLLAVILVVGLVAVITRNRKALLARQLGFRRCLRWPPLWFGVVFGCVLLCSLESFETGNSITLGHLGDIFRGEVKLAASLLLLLPLPLSLLWMVALSIPPEASANASRSLESLDALLEWIKDDDEPIHPREDRFAVAPIARRISQRLRIAEPPTIAVLGAPGAGKSTICSFVAAYLRDDRRTLLVPVSLWPFESAHAAVSGVLAAISEALEREIDTLSVQGLPARYVDAISASGGWGGPFGRLLEVRRSPKELVESLSTVLSQIGLRVVVWLDDLERFAEHETGDVGPVKALLHLIDRSSAVTVVLASTSLAIWSDIHKLVRYVETLPPLDPDSVWRWIDMLRSSALDGKLGAFMDPCRNEVRGQWRPKRTLDRTLLRMLSDRPSVDESVAILARTPRTLKMALRMTVETWQTLPGELDVDDLLIVSTLRSTVPEVYAVLDEHIDALRTGFRRAADDLDPVQHPAAKQIRASIDGDRSPEQASAIHTLVSSLFPQWPARRGAVDTRGYVERPQTVADHRHADYWVRIKTVPDIPVQDRDQTVMQEIRSWKEDGNGSIIARLTDPSRSRQVETFVGQFDPSHLLMLLEQMTRKGLQTRGVVDVAEHFVTPVFRMIQAARKRPIGSDVYRTVNMLIDESTPKALQLAWELQYYFASEDATDGPLDREAREGVREHLLQAFVELCARGGQGLATAMQGANPYVVMWICWGLVKVRHEGFRAAPFDTWPIVRKALLEAARLPSQPAMAAIVGMITRLGWEHDIAAATRKRIATFDKALATELFGLEDLRRAFVGQVPPPGAEGALHASYEAVRIGLAESI